MKRIDLTGQRFGKLTVIEYSHTNKFAYWRCRCNCGESAVVHGWRLRRGLTVNCGCERRTRGVNQPVPDPTESILNRFWAKVEKAGPDECWLWIGSADHRGYGRMSIGVGTPFLATRISYKIATGDDPGTKVVCHTCDNPQCVNPAHLWLGTTLDNNRDSMEKRRNTFGQRNAQAKLTESEVREILASDELQRVLAERYGVSSGAIGDIKRGRTWKHLQKLPI